MKRIICVVFLLVSVCLSATAQKLTQDEKAMNCLVNIVAGTAESLPLTQGAITTNKMEIEDGWLTSTSTITDFNIYQNYKAQTDALKEFYVQSLSASPSQASVMTLMLNDLKMGVKYKFRSPAGTSSFEIVITPEEIHRIAGGEHSRKEKISIIDEFFTVFANPSNESGDFVRFSEKMATNSFHYDMKYEELGRTLDKYYVMGNVSGLIEANNFLIDLCIYLDLPSTLEYICTDRTVSAKCSLKDILEIKEIKSKYPQIYVSKEDEIEIVYDETIEEEPIPFAMIEQKPLFEGKDPAETFQLFVNSKLVYPEIARENGVQGQVLLTITIEKDGSLTDVRVLRGVDPSLDQAAVKAVMQSPKWTPGKHDGRNVRVNYIFPVNFKLD